MNMILYQSDIKRQKGNKLPYVILQFHDVFWAYIWSELWIRYNLNSVEYPRIRPDL